MHKIFIVLFLLTFSQSYSQDNWTNFTGKQKAFFYQLTRKIENMEPQVFHLFEFTDSIPYINDTLPDYSYIEKLIVSDSSKLILHKSQFARKNNGIISDVATHYAIWELDLLLHFRNSKKVKFAYLNEKMKVFEHYVLEKAPQSAVRTLNDGSYSLSPTLSQYYSPNLTIGEKIAAIKNASFTENEQLLIIRAIYYAQEKYVSIRSKEIFDILGGDADAYNNFLVAAGDGDSWSDLESILRTKYNRALPDPKALFKFETDILKDDKFKKNILKVKSNPTKEINTKANLPTKIHVDVWGYHPERQTTIVVQKGGNSYILYGSSENRYVTPDSTFESGSTYWRLIYELEHIHIAELKEMIYGKKGFDFWILDYESRIDKTLLKIKISEEKLNKMRYTPSPTPKIKKKKKKNFKKTSGISDQDNQGHPTAKPTSEAKKKNKEQSWLIHLNSQLVEEKRTLRELKVDKEKAYDLLSQYQTQLDLMMKNVGHTFVEFDKTKNGNYLFTDGTAFNYLEQDLTFQADSREQSFEIVTIAFGESVFSKTTEEVFVHYNITFPDMFNKYTLYKEVDSRTENNKITVSDSIQIMELFNELGNTKKKFIIKSIGGGIMGGETRNYYRDSIQSVIAYDKDLKQNNTVYTYNVNIDETIEMNINSYRHNMIPFQFNAEFSKYFIAARSKNSHLNEIDFYTTLLAKKRMDIWLDQLSGLAEEWLLNSNIQSTVLNKIKKAKNNNFYSITSTNKIKLPKK
jgi:hypothetical protein